MPAGRAAGNYANGLFPREFHFGGSNNVHVFRPVCYSVGLEVLMVSFVLAGIFDVAVAVALISSVARLLRRDGSAVLPSYLFYLVFW